MPHLSLSDGSPIARAADWREAFALAWRVNAIVAENRTVALWRNAGRALQLAGARRAPRLAVPKPARTAARRAKERQ